MAPESHIKGTELSRSFYLEAVKPWIGVAHGAALTGEGSEVLGYDTARSTDHNWGPRITVFVRKKDVGALVLKIGNHLPDMFRGFPIRAYQKSDSEEKSVEVTSVEDWLLRTLRIADMRDIKHWQWLGFPQQHLLQCTSGCVFHDDLGELTQAMQILSYYPRDIWLWMMASQWYQIGVVEPLLHRALEVDDRIGVRLLFAKLVRYSMELRFLQARRYWPYDKWFGTAFSMLPGSGDIMPIIVRALDAGNVNSQLSSIKALMLRLGERHNELRITSHKSPRYGLFAVGIDGAVRPYDVMNAGDFKDACLNAISEPSLRNMIWVGAIDQLTHANDALINFTHWPGQISELYKTNLENQAGPGPKRSGTP